MSDFSNINITDINDNNGDNFYNDFRQKLIDIEQFPSIYTFKFIIPKDQEKQNEVEKIFDHPSSKFSIKESKTGKYNSITVQTYVNTADHVIDYYKKISTIEKVIML